MNNEIEHSATRNDFVLAMERKGMYFKLKSAKSTEKKS